MSGAAPKAGSLPPWPQSICGGVAVALPLLLAWATVPDSVLYNQLAALAGWGVWLAVGPRSEFAVTERAPLWAASAALAALAAFAAVAHGVGQGGSALVLCAAVFVLWAGASSGPAERKAFAWALWLVGTASVVVALLQYFAPDWADGTLVAVNTSPGRAVGNMRQPNHLATALLCAMVMTAWLWQAGQLGARVAVVSIVAMVLALAMSASRTGAISLVVLVGWAVFDRTLPRSVRWTLATAPLVYALCWAALAAATSLLAAHFYGAERLSANGDISSSRFAIWSNALALIAQHPWGGVGWGNFNLAWTFTPFPDRPVAFFDHSHNALLQLAAETGLPATLGLFVLLGWALWRACGAWRGDAHDPGHLNRAAWALLSVMAVHSLLEYPLWYDYFLLPGAWVLGVLVGGAAPAGTGRTAASPSRAAVGRAGLRLGGALMLAGALYAAWDHRRVEVIFAPSAGAAPLGARIAEGRKSVLFGHHADYAAVTAEPRDQRLESFRRPLRQLIDVRLLIAYIEALHANGRDAEALYAAQRLREFRRADAQAYFKDCTPDNPDPPFQCERRPMPLNWRDLEP